MNLQCFYKLFSNRTFFKLISGQQQEANQTVFVTRATEEHGDTPAQGLCQDGVCSLSNWKPGKSA
jgi:hypothetical protein